MINGKYITSDDFNMWLAPYKYKGMNNFIEIDLEREREISMIRIWNYNKNRIHCYRGIKDIVIEMDDKKVFEGEIKRGVGNTTDV